MLVGIVWRFKIHDLHVLGGLDEKVTEDMVLNLFTTFGEVSKAEIPLDHATCMLCVCLASHCTLTFVVSSRGFAFVEFVLAEDAEHAMDNLNNAEYYGRILKINYAHQFGTNANVAIWESEEYIKKEMESKMEEYN